MKNDWWWLSLASMLYRCNKNFISLHLIRGSGIRISHHMPSGEAAEKAMIYLWITALPPSTGLAKAEQQNGKPYKASFVFSIDMHLPDTWNKPEQSPPPASSRMAARPEKWRLPHIWSRLFGEGKLRLVHHPGPQSSWKPRPDSAPRHRPGGTRPTAPRGFGAACAPRPVPRPATPRSADPWCSGQSHFGSWANSNGGPSGHHTLCIWKYTLLNKLSCFRSCKQSTLWYPLVHAIKAGHAKSWYRHLSVRRQWLESSQKIHCTQRLRSTPSSLADGFNPGNPWKPATAFGKGSINSEKH